MKSVRNLRISKHCTTTWWLYRAASSSFSKPTTFPPHTSVRCSFVSQFLTYALRSVSKCIWSACTTTLKPPYNVPSEETVCFWFRPLASNPFHFRFTWSVGRSVGSRCCRFFYRRTQDTSEQQAVFVAASPRHAILSILYNFPDIVAVIDQYLWDWLDMWHT